VPYDGGWPAGHRDVAERTKGGFRGMNWLFWIIVVGVVGAVIILFALRAMSGRGTTA
jgi:hypothetical protein